jgi:hypothetical protein
MLRLLTLVLAIGACGSLHVAPVSVQPIHITVDVNVHDQDSKDVAAGREKKD